MERRGNRDPSQKRDTCQVVASGETASNAGLAPGEGEGGSRHCSSFETFNRIGICIAERTNSGTISKTP